MDERAHCTVYLGASSISHPKHKWYLIYSIYLPFGDIARAIHRFILLIETEMFRENRVTKWWMVSRLIYYLILSVSLSYATMFFVPIDFVLAFSHTRIPWKTIMISRQSRNRPQMQLILILMFSYTNALEMMVAFFFFVFVCFGSTI